jgi:hypothetical protein
MVSTMGWPAKDGKKMDDAPPAADASPSGIAECLRMLADEAASLRLVRTFSALRETLEICRIEASAIASPGKPGEKGGPAALIIH